MPLTTGGPSNFDLMLTATTQMRNRQLVDNIFNSTPTLMYLDAKDRKKMQDGGESILKPLLYAKHTGVQPYHGYQTIDVDPQEGVTSAQYVWKEYACPITISRRERRQNSGEHAIISMMETKQQQAELTFIDTMNTDLLGTNAADPLRILGIQDFLVDQAEGSQTGTVGGINRATYTWWNNKRQTLSNFSTDGLNKMRTGYNSASQGADHPDFGVTTQTAYENYERVLEARERYSTGTGSEMGQRVAEAGFDFLKFKGMLLFYDDACKADTMFLMNSRYMDLTVDTESDFAIQPFITPSNQTATTALILFMGAFCMSNLSRQALISGVDTF